VSFAVITLCVVSQRVFIFVVVYFVADLVRKLLDIPSCVCVCVCVCERESIVTRTSAEYKAIEMKYFNVTLRTNIQNSRKS
jgi:hypothetical protein